MYRPLYDDKHRFHVLSAKDADVRRFEQKGIREKLLCKECEAQLSKHEHYISRVFSGSLPVSSEKNGNLVKIQGLNYLHFRLFGLSVLWRAGVSKHRYFQKVNLGPHEESIRKLLAADDPGEPHVYGFFLAPILFHGKEIKDLMIEPTHSRLDQHLCYRFVFGGLVWIFVVSSHGLPHVFREAVINRSGEMLMLVSEFKDLPFIYNFMREVTKNN